MDLADLPSTASAWSFLLSGSKMLAEGASKCDVVRWAAKMGGVGSQLSRAAGSPRLELRRRANARPMTGSASSGDARRRAPHHEEGPCPKPQICPSCQFAAIGVIDLTPKSATHSAASRPTEGRLAIVTDAGRDAVDVSSAADERAHLADGEGVWS